MEEKYYYIYKWYNIDNGEVFYIGKGCRGRYNQISQRNNIFKEYYNTHNCAVEKIEYFDNEQNALLREHQLILEYKEKNQAIANLDNGGRGGLSFIWTDEMRAYKSKYNPMKTIEQRERMSKNNPMKNPEIAKKVGLKNRRPVIINNKEYSGLVEAAKELQVDPFTIEKWCKQGYDTKGNPCRYADETQKEYSDFIKKYGTNIIQGKAILIDNVYYPTIKLGAQAINGTSSGLCEALKKNRKYKGHICSYANQQPSQENNQ